MEQKPLLEKRRPLPPNSDDPNIQKIVKYSNQFYNPTGELSSNKFTQEHLKSWNEVGFRGPNEPESSLEICLKNCIGGKNSYDMAGNAMRRVSGTKEERGKEIRRVLLYLLYKDDVALASIGAMNQVFSTGTKGAVNIGRAGVNAASSAASSVKNKFNSFFSTKKNQGGKRKRKGGKGTRRR